MHRRQQRYEEPVTRNDSYSRHQIHRNERKDKTIQYAEIKRPRKENLQNTIKCTVQEKATKMPWIAPQVRNLNNTNLNDIDIWWETSIIEDNKKYKIEEFVPLPKKQWKTINVETDETDETNETSEKNYHSVIKLPGYIQRVVIQSYGPGRHAGRWDGTWRDGMYKNDKTQNTQDNINNTMSDGNNEKIIEQKLGEILDQQFSDIGPLGDNTVPYHQRKNQKKHIDKSPYTTTSIQQQSEELCNLGYKLVQNKSTTNTKNVQEIEKSTNSIELTTNDENDIVTIILPELLCKNISSDNLQWITPILGVGAYGAVFRACSQSKDTTQYAVKRQEQKDAKTSLGFHFTTFREMYQQQNLHTTTVVGLEEVLQKINNYKNILQYKEIFDDEIVNILCTPLRYKLQSSSQYENIQQQQNWKKNDTTTTCNSSSGNLYMVFNLCGQDQESFQYGDSKESQREAKQQRLIKTRGEGGEVAQSTQQQQMGQDKLEQIWEWQKESNENTIKSQQTIKNFQSTNNEEENNNIKNIEVYKETIQEIEEGQKNIKKEQINENKCTNRPEYPNTIDEQEQQYKEGKKEVFARKDNGGQNVSQVQYIMYYIQKAQENMHERNVQHRDIKASNVQIGKDGEVHVLDQGLSRACDPYSYRSGQTNRVITIPYRAPEILLGSTRYTSKVDIWSAGILFLEQLLGVNIFGTNRTDMEQLIRIFTTIGIPTPIRWENFFEEYTIQPQNLQVSILACSLIQNINFSTGNINIQEQQQPLHIPKSVVCVLQNMLELNPMLRITAKECLEYESVFGSQFIISQQAYTRFFACTHR